MQLEQLPVKLRGKIRPHLAYYVSIKQGAVERAYYVITYKARIFRAYGYVYTFHKMVGYVAVGTHALHHLIYNGTFAYAVDSAQYVHASVELPYNVSAAAPKGVYLYFFYVVGVFLHNIDFILTYSWQI